MPAIDSLMKVCGWVERAVGLSEPAPEVTPPVDDDAHWPVTGDWITPACVEVDRGCGFGPRLWLGAAEWCPGLGVDGELLIDHGPIMATGGYERRTLRTRHEVRLYAWAFKIPLPAAMRPLWTPPPPVG